jgi:hypothetical protein
MYVEMRRSKEMSRVVEEVAGEVQAENEDDDYDPDEPCESEAEDDGEDEGEKAEEGATDRDGELNAVDIDVTGVGVKREIDRDDFERGAKKISREVVTITKV